MKQVVWGIAAGIIVIYVTLIVLTQHGRLVRETEVEHNLAEALEVTMNAAKRGSLGEIDTDEELAAAFVQQFLVQCSSESDVELRILESDVHTGLLSVEAVEHYYHPNGREGTVSVHRTVVIDREEEIS